MLKALVCVCHPPPLPLSTAFPFLSLSFLSIPPLSLSLDPSLHLPLQQAHQCITHPHLPFPFFPCVCCHLFFLTPNLLDTSFSPSFCFPPSLSASVFPCLSPSPSLSACPLFALYSSSLRFPLFFILPSPALSLFSSVCLWGQRVVRPARRHQQHRATASSDVCVCLRGWLALCPDPPPVVKLFFFAVWTAAQIDPHKLTHTYRHANTFTDKLSATQMWALITHCDTHTHWMYSKKLKVYSLSLRKPQSRSHWHLTFYIKNYRIAQKSRASSHYFIYARKMQQKVQWFTEKHVQTQTKYSISRQKLSF